jgi:hypothetical protein
MVTVARGQPHAEDHLLVHYRFLSDYVVSPGAAKASNLTVELQGRAISEAR